MPEEEQTSRSSAAKGCNVDWSWLAGREVASVQSDLQSFVLTFRDGQTLVVRAELFQGAPFLSFAPWGPP
jgi:hypothetical protein